MSRRIHKSLGTEVPRLSAGSSNGGTYIRARKCADYLNSAHHKRPKQARLAQVKANRKLDQNSNHLCIWLQREGNASQKSKHRVAIYTCLQLPTSA